MSDLARISLEKTGSFQKEESLSQSAFVERQTTPELTSPGPTKSLLGMVTHHRTATADQCVGVHLCCHEQTKEQAVLQQKVQFLNEQIKDEKAQAAMKDQQFNKMIAALKRTAEENNARSQAELAEARNAMNTPIPSDVKETLNELQAKKEEVNKLEE